MPSGWEQRWETGGLGDGEARKGPAPVGTGGPGVPWRRQDPKLLYRPWIGHCQLNGDLREGLIQSSPLAWTLPVMEAGPQLREGASLGLAGPLPTEDPTTTSSPIGQLMQ